jgi:hypothetical protein
MDQPSNFSSVTMIYNNGENILNRGIHNNVKSPVKMVLQPRTRVHIYDMPYMSGDNVILDNATLNVKEIDVTNLVASNSIRCINSMNVMSQVCTDSCCGMNREGFGNKEVRDSCHYICSLVSPQNILLVIVLLVLIYYLIISYKTDKDNKE